MSVMLYISSVLFRILWMLRAIRFKNHYSTPCQEKMETTSILGITLTKFNKWRKFDIINMPFSRAVASKFARFKSGWLQRVERTARECVQNTHHCSCNLKSQNRVDQARSRRYCCSCASVAWSSFSLCRGGIILSIAFNSDIVFCDNSGL